MAQTPRRDENGHDRFSALAASAELFTRDHDNGVVTLTLNTPRNLNALSLAMLEALVLELEAIASDDQARVIVLAGVGPALSAGHNLKEMQAHRNDCDRGRELLRRAVRALLGSHAGHRRPAEAGDRGDRGRRHRGRLPARRRLRSCGRGRESPLRPVGREFGLFCSTPLVAVGRTISRKRAMEMAMTGQLYSAAEAEHFGLINRVVPEGHAVEEAQALAKTIAQQSGPDARDRQARLLRPDRAAARPGLFRRLIRDDRQPRRTRLRRRHERVPREAPADMGARRRRLSRDCNPGASCEIQIKGSKRQ